MAFRGRLEITDGVTYIDLLGNASTSTFSLLEWEPAAPDVKGGGIWMDNPLLDGRELAIRKESNIIETFSLSAKGQTATDIHTAITKLRYMLNRATGYWTNRARYPDPIYLLIQYPEETEPYWALIYDYRLPQLTNPFVQPLFKTKKAVIPEFTLVLERGLRSPVTGISCADLNFQKIWFSLQDDTYYPAASTDDCEVNITAASIVLNGTTGRVGRFTTDRYGIGVRFINVTIPAGATIIRAYLKVTSAITATGNKPPMIIDGELDAAPAVFSTFVNYDARIRTEAKAHITVDDMIYVTTTGIVYNIPNSPIAIGIEEVLQEIISLGGWASGNDLVLFIESDTDALPSQYILSAMEDHAALNPIGLYIEWIEESTTKISTIDNDDCMIVPLTNQMKFSQINTVQRYNATGATYDILSGTALPWDLINDVAVNSAVYFACNLNSTALTCYAIVLNLTSGFADTITVVWETYNGAFWVAATDLVDGSNGLKNVGLSVVHWTPSDTMSFVGVNGITASYIRARISVVGGASATIPTHNGDDEVLNPGYPYIDITNIPMGDVRVPIQIIARPVGSGSSEVNYTLDELWIAICDLEKKRNFIPFINITSSAYQRPPGVTITTAYLYGSIYDGPDEYALSFSEAGVQAETDVFSLDFDNVATPNYYGKFRVFLRRSGGTNPENCSFRLRLTTDAAGGATPLQYQTDLIPDTDNPDYSIMDFGTITIPENLESFHLVVSGATSAAAAVGLVDLIMLPVDEMFIHVYQRIGADITAWEQVYDDTAIVIDSSQDVLKAWIQRAGLVVSPLMLEANGDIDFDPLKDYRMWFFAGTYTSSCTNYQRTYWPGLDTSVVIKFLREKI